MPLKFAATILIPSVLIFAAQSATKLEKVEKNREEILDDVREIALSGLASLKKLYDLEKNGGKGWGDLEKSVGLLIEHERDSLKQNGAAQNQNFVQNVINGFQNFTGNFVQNFLQFGGSGNGTFQPGFGQNFISSFNGGVQQITNNLNNLLNRKNSTILGNNRPTIQRPIFNEGTFQTNQSLIGLIGSLLQGQNQGQPIKPPNIVQSIGHVFQNVISGGAAVNGSNQVAAVSQNVTTQAPSDVNNQQPVTPADTQLQN